MQISWEMFWDAMSAIGTIGAVVGAETILTTDPSAIMIAPA